MCIHALVVSLKRFSATFWKDVCSPTCFLLTELIATVYILLMDNASIHHTERVAKLIQSAGAIMHFIPPYSPDLNPSASQK